MKPTKTGAIRKMTHKRNHAFAGGKGSGLPRMRSVVTSVGADTSDLPTLSPMASYEEILAYLLNPKATPKELRALWSGGYLLLRKYQALLEAFARNPNIPLDLLLQWEIISRVPEAFLQNPVLLMLKLENAEPFYSTGMGIASRVQADSLLVFGSSIEKPTKTQRQLRELLLGPVIAKFSGFQKPLTEFGEVRITETGVVIASKKNGVSGQYFEHLDSASDEFGYAWWYRHKSDGDLRGYLRSAVKKEGDWQPWLRSSEEDEIGRGLHSTVASVGGYFPVIDIPCFLASEKALEAIKVLSARSARLFGADCAEYVLPLYQAPTPNNPNEGLPRMAIEAARRAAHGASVDLETRGRMALVAAEETYYINRAAYHAATSAAVSCTVPTGQFYFRERRSPVTERFSANGALMEGFWAIEESLGGRVDAGGRAAERIYPFAWERLQEYLQLDANEAIATDHAQGIYPLSGNPNLLAFGTLVRRQTIEVFAKMEKMGAPTQNAAKLLMECANDIARQDDAEFWATNRVSPNCVETALILLLRCSWLDSAVRGFEDWRGVKPQPKRPKKGV